MCGWGSGPLRKPTNWLQSVYDFPSLPKSSSSSKQLTSGLRVETDQSLCWLSRPLKLTVEIGRRLVIKLGRIDSLVFSWLLPKTTRQRDKHTTQHMRKKSMKNDSNSHLWLMLKKQQKPKKLSGNACSCYHPFASRDASLHSLLSSHRQVIKVFFAILHSSLEKRRPKS